MAVCYGFQQPRGSPGLRLSDTPNIGMLNFNTLAIEVLIHNIFGILAQALRENMHAFRNNPQIISLPVDNV